MPSAQSHEVADELNYNPMSELMRALDASDCSALLAAAEDIHYADLAHLYENLDDLKRDLLLKTIGPELATDVVAELPYPLIEEALNHFKPAQLRVLLGNLSDDDRVDVFQVVSEEARVRFFSLLGPRDKELTRNLLKYEEDTAGGRMTTQVGRITADMTVKQAITVLRRDREDAETLARIFVVDDQGRLVGKVRLRDLAFSTWDTPVYDIMEPADETILASADQEEAARTLSKYDLIVLPVVDEFHHLLGVLTYDDALEILQEESTEDIEKLSGIAGEQSEVSYLNTGVIAHYRRRVSWLVGLAFLSVVSGYVMFRCSEVLEKAFVLALFLPMVVAAGGNSGGQAATMVIRAMALGEISTGNALRIAWKEARTGISLGITLGITMAAFISFILPHLQHSTGADFSFLQLALAVSLALVVQVLSATVLGALLPIFARTIHLDPAVVSAPSLASTVDISGMMIYFTIVGAVLHLH
ncbi:MAG: magnesium transporter [Akkermansiaceae bacterium]|nr:magnesium transporter [Akkermansiaceae bacterium]MBJ7284007.1 magnesium transporter [Akkermansiaceae bacterium]MBJ7394846.1 magnesium transporter [Akkermansiaceae bacterium]MBJ7423766.1 magnesium transporter [Akkermansiaceae bacterium]